MDKDTLHTMDKNICESFLDPYTELPLPHDTICLDACQDVPGIWYEHYDLPPDIMEKVYARLISARP